VLLGLGKFKRIREIDFDNRVVVTEPGVTNLAISQRWAHGRVLLRADPSSQIACSIGGNVAEKFRRVPLPEIRHDHNNVLAARSC